MVTSTVSLRTGEKHSFSNQIELTNGQITNEKLRESVQGIQKELNDFLTSQVDIAKGSAVNRKTNAGDASQDDDLDESDDDGDDLNDEDQEPSAKEQPTEEPPDKKPKK
ncbi:nucleolin-like [Asterias rubens]|uniref:nucleolin-like n=1 Tax=Asterias rubens TaxID=7604 RepID=UPI001455AA8D|nr:nucleolin-like [Asterias rubens]